MKKWVCGLAITAAFAGGHFSALDPVGVSAQADITNPEAITFCNEEVRPLAEDVRALKARIDASVIRWYAGINAKIPNDSSALQDGREAEGVSRLEGTNINSFMGVLVNLQTSLDAAGVDGIVSLPCVRALSAT